jgi:hypothetical protein
MELGFRSQKQTIPETFTNGVAISRMGFSLTRCEFVFSVREAHRNIAKHRTIVSIAIVTVVIKKNGRRRTKKSPADHFLI